MKSFVAQKTWKKSETMKTQRIFVFLFLKKLSVEALTLWFQNRRQACPDAL